MVSVTWKQEKVLHIHEPHFGFIIKLCICYQNQNQFFLKIKHGIRKILFAYPMQHDPMHGLKVKNKGFKISASHWISGLHNTFVQLWIKHSEKKRVKTEDESQWKSCIKHQMFLIYALFKHHSQLYMTQSYLMFFHASLKLNFFILSKKFW